MSRKKGREKKNYPVRQEVEIIQLAREKHPDLQGKMQDYLYKLSQTKDK